MSSNFGSLGSAKVAAVRPEDGLGTGPGLTAAAPGIWFDSRVRDRVVGPEEVGDSDARPVHQCTVEICTTCRSYLAILAFQGRSGQPYYRPQADSFRSYLSAKFNQFVPTEYLAILPFFIMVAKDKFRLPILECHHLLP